MKTQDHINFDRIAEAIGYINTNFKQQPNLDKIAEKVHLSADLQSRLTII